MTPAVTAATKVAALKGEQEEEPGNREGEKASEVQVGKIQGANGLAICCLTPKYIGVYISNERVSAIPMDWGHIR